MRVLLISLLLSVTASIASLSTVLAADKNLNIAMVVWRGETPAEQGFRDGLTELGYVTRFTVFDAGQEKNKLSQLLRGSIIPNAGEYDYIYTFGTTASKTTQTMLDERAPQIFNIVTAPVQSGLVDSMSSPGRNIGGVTQFVNLELQLETALKVISVKRLGLLFNPREKNSMIIRDRLIQASKQFGFEVIDLKSPPARNYLEANLDSLDNGSVVVDAVYLPADSFLVSNAERIGSRLRAAKIKSIGAVKPFIDKGALVGVVANYSELGRAAAAIVGRNQKGEKLGSIAVTSPKSPTLIINRATALELGVTVPSGMQAKYIE